MFKWIKRLFKKTDKGTRTGDYWSYYDDRVRVDQDKTIRGQITYRVYELDEEDGRFKEVFDALVLDEALQFAREVK